MTAQQAQELFTTVERTSRRRRQAVDKGMALWRESAEKYRVLPYKFLFFTELNKELNLHLTRLRAVKLDRDQYPEIDFFRITDEQMARAYLEDSPLDDLELELRRIEDTLSEDYVYNSIKDWVIEADYKISHQKPRNSLAMIV